MKQDRHPQVKTKTRRRRSPFLDKTSTSPRRGASFRKKQRFKFDCAASTHFALSRRRRRSPFLDLDKASTSPRRGASFRKKAVLQVRRFAFAFFPNMHLASARCSFRSQDAERVNVCRTHLDLNSPCQASPQGSELADSSRRTSRRNEKTKEEENERVNAC